MAQISRVGDRIRGREGPFVDVSVEGRLPSVLVDDRPIDVDNDCV